MLSAGVPGTGACWTAKHKSPTELAQIAQWRMATALRLDATPDAGPRYTCALRKGNDGYAANMEEPGPDRTVQPNAPCGGSSSRQEALRMWSAMSLSSTTGEQRQ